MAELLSRAVTIGVTEYGDSDKIVTFYSERYGKISGIAKGAKRSKKRFVNKLEYFSLLNLCLHSSRKSTLLRLDSADLIKSYQSLSESYRKYTAAMLVIELIGALTREYDSDPNLYHLLSWSLDRIAETEEQADTVVFFQLKLLHFTGFLPQLTGCAACGGLLEEKSLFLPSADGLYCSSCLPARGPASPSRLSISTLRTLEMARSLPLEKISRVRLTPASCRESLRLFKTCIHYLLQREIHSWREFEKII